MKHINKVVLSVVLGASALTACTDNFEKYNSDPYAIYKADPSVLLPAMIEPVMYVQQNNSQMIDQMVGALGGYMTCSNRWGGQNFDTYNASDGWNAIPFNTTYENLVNIFDVEKATNKAGHYYAMALLLKASALMRVADCYGGIPYSSVANNSFRTGYDTPEETYKNIIADLRQSATILYQYSVAYPASRPLGNADPIYQGDYAMWARLANSLALRAAIRTDDRQAAEEVCESPAGLIENNSQNALVDPGVQGNPYQLASASWGDLRISSSIVDYMQGYNDPRMASYFTKSSFDATRYIGMRSGEAGFDKAAVSGYSQINATASTKMPVCLAAEVCFLRAEGALKGWNMGGSAQEFYERGIRLSMEQYGVDATTIEAYIVDDTHTPEGHANDPRGSKYNYDRQTKVKVKWNADNSQQNLERIITQKWIANFPLGLEAWAEYRRTGYPELAPAISNLNQSVITDMQRGMRRLRYPYTERDLNRENYDKAVQQLGGADNEATDLFWAKKK